MLCRTYGYADDGYLTRVEDLTGTTDLVSTLTLDPLRRITTVTTNSAAATQHQTEQYTYDTAGNITDAVQPGNARTTHVYDDAGRLITRRTKLLSGGTRTHTYTWDHTPDGLTPLTQRTRAQRDHAEQDAAEHDQAWYDEQFHAIITDLVGTPTDLVTPDGTLTWTRRTTIWGAPLDTPTTNEPTVTCLLLFPGQYTDTETGLAYNYFRHYDPTTGRYASTDPLGLLGSPNPATYVDNPTAWTDPLGLTPYGIVTLFHGTDEAGVAGIRARGFDMAFANPRTDFGAGFYLTREYGQALLRAGDESRVLTYSVPRAQLDNLTGLVFRDGGEAFSEFVRGLRNGGVNAFDFVEGAVSYRRSNSG